MRPLLLLPLFLCSAWSSIGGMGGLDAVASPVAGKGVCRSGCVRSSFSPFLAACGLAQVYRCPGRSVYCGSVSPELPFGPNRGLCLVSELSGCREVALAAGGVMFGAE